MRREEFTLCHRLRVRWAEVDRQDVVFNGHYFLYFDVAIAEYWRAIRYNYPADLVALGMDWKQAVFTIALANVIVLLPMLATGHAGPKYGIPFPVLARASFGLRGANIPAMIRAAVACGWSNGSPRPGGRNPIPRAARSCGAPCGPRGSGLGGRPRTGRPSRSSSPS